MPSGSSSPTHYEILGVSRTAGADEIKAAYRRLARTAHPDVNTGDPRAGEKFAAVNAAYKTLSDTLARSNYDAELSLADRRAETARVRSGGSTATYGTPPPRPGAPQNAPRPAGPPPSAGDEAARLVAQARAALSRMGFVEARDLAQASLRMKRTAEGYETLGDVYRLQGRTEEAINMYTMSLQLNPRNSAVMDRLQRLARGSYNAAPPRRSEPRYDLGSDAPRARGQANPMSEAFRAPRAAPEPYVARAGSVGQNISPDKRPLLTLFALVFGYGSAILLLLTLVFYARDAPTSGALPFAMVSKWSGALLAILAGCGALLGWTMSVTGAVRRLDDELIFGRASSGFVPPIGTILLLLSALSFWAAAALHLVLSALQEARVAGILKAFGATAAVVFFAALVYGDGAAKTQVLLWGGNVVFLMYIFGWFVGDLFRTD